MKFRAALRLPLASVLLIATLSAVPVAAAPTSDGPVSSIIERIVRVLNNAKKLLISHPNEDPVVPKP